MIHLYLFAGDTILDGLGEILVLKDEKRTSFTADPTECHGITFKSLKPEYKDNVFEINKMSDSYDIMRTWNDKIGHYGDFEDLKIVPVPEYIQRSYPTGNNTFGFRNIFTNEKRFDADYYDSIRTLPITEDILKRSKNVKCKHVLKSGSHLVFTCAYNRHMYVTHVEKVSQSMISRHYQNTKVAVFSDKSIYIGTGIITESKGYDDIIIVNTHLEDDRERHIANQIKSLL